MKSFTTPAPGSKIKCALRTSAPRFFLLRVTAESKDLSKVMMPVQIGGCWHHKRESLGVACLSVYLLSVTKTYCLPVLPFGYSASLHVNWLLGGSEAHETAITSPDYKTLRILVFAYCSPTSKSIAVNFRRVGTTGTDQNYVQQELKEDIKSWEVSILVSPVREPNSDDAVLPTLCLLSKQKW
jgi:hypothetical protein